MLPTVHFRAAATDGALKLQYLALRTLERARGVVRQVRWLRFALVAASIPPLALLAARLGVPLPAAICALMGWGPIAWILLGMALTGIVARTRLAPIAKEARAAGLLRDPGELENRDVSLDIDGAGLKLSFSGGDRQYAWREVERVLVTDDAVWIVLAAQLAWRVPLEAFGTRDAMNTFCRELEALRTRGI